MKRGRKNRNRKNRLALQATVRKIKLLIEANKPELDLLADKPQESHAK